MNAERLLSHYERIADAPGAIARLRRFVVELAAHGKLVPQYASDQPASELLKRIGHEQARLVKVGKVKNAKAPEPIRDSELPIELPRNWAWARLCEIGKLSGGMTPSMNRPDFWAGDVVWLSPKDIKSDEVADSELKISALGLAETRLELYRPGCLFMVARSGILKRTFPVSINRVPAAANQDMKVLVPFLHGQERFLQIMFRGLTNFILRELVKTGTTVQSLKYAEFEQQPFPLPPLAEQRRIVAKVDELMLLCDRLEAARVSRETVLDRLTVASLTRLSAPDPKTFQAGARFVLDTLPALTTRPDQIKQLRRTILNLAVRGKLVAQAPSDKPTSELLKRITKEKAQLLTTGAIPRQTKAVRDPTKLTEELPASWSPIALGEVCNLVTSGSRGWAEFYSTSGSGFIRAQNIRFGKLRLNDLAFVNPPSNSEGSRTQATKGDLLVVITGAGVTNPALLDHDLGEAYVSQHVALVRPSDPQLSSWLLLCLMADAGGRAELVERAYGSGKPGLNLDNIRSLSIPLPPLAEQHRIVAKVHALIALCDRIESQLINAAETRRRLLDALLAEALAPAEPCEREAAE
ncbi:restriction endonuclease subunit S [Bradyrhizobium septentrionale]|uniref:Restriction endonuclease subunit S n=1 Tax=Bradyrhizobium septentrionale TaxID=1404411 RepID=A0A973VU39_9BRAD|nr:restriction endonuclease subunit S [Bradyrhizobium septentrionale]UGY18994.1 restriction endonuclease subunit S [Bradyrhizobium septentrionale]UGY27715.1 restriction endonuclease subunit S [Bradyrhizobium septentrionale]